MGEDLGVIEHRTAEAREDLLKAHAAERTEQITAFALRGLLTLAVGMAEQIIEQEREA